MAEERRSSREYAERVQERSEETSTGWSGSQGPHRDHQILAMLRHNHEKAVEKLMESYHARLYAVASGICDNPLDAEEVLQDVYMTALDKVDRFEERSSLYTWLYRITVNAALMKRRKNRRHDSNTMYAEEYGAVSETADLLRSDVMFQEDALFVSELSEGFFETLEAMPEIYRSVALLSADGYSTSEMSKILKLSPAAVKSRIHRSRNFFREAMKGYLSNN